MCCIHVLQNGNLWSCGYNSVGGLLAWHTWSPVINAQPNIYWPWWFVPVIEIWNVWDIISTNIETKKNVYLWIYLVFSFWIMDKSFNSSSHSVRTKITAMSSSFHGPRVTAALGNSERRGQWVASFDSHYSYHLTVGFTEDRIARCFILSSEVNFPIRVVFEVLTGYFPCI